MANCCNFLQSTYFNWSNVCLNTQSTYFLVLSRRECGEVPRAEWREQPPCYPEVGGSISGAGK